MRSEALTRHLRFFYSISRSSHHHRRQTKFSKSVFNNCWMCTYCLLSRKAISHIVNSHIEDEGLPLYLLGYINDNGHSLTSLPDLNKVQGNQYYAVCSYKPFWRHIMLSHRDLFAVCCRWAAQWHETLEL